MSTQLERTGEDLMWREQSIVRTFVELTDTLVEDFDVVELLTVLAARCVEVLDVAAAGLMLVSPDNELRVIASSSEAMRLLELFELQSEEGPCTECFATGSSVVHPRLSEGDLRWPRFSPRALEAGFQSVQALPMRLRGQTIGALNLFRTDTGSLTEADMTTAQAFADVATIAILQNRAASEAQAVNDQLNHALNSRIVIEQAKGMVAERDGLDMDQSFRRLRSYARSHNLRLVDVACSVIDGSLGTGSLDPKAARREA
ncbi:MAG: GAF and ANTAR domain-containing protein [Acidimicrobiales bacterium]